MPIQILHTLVVLLLEVVTAREFALRLVNPAPLPVIFPPGRMVRLEMVNPFGLTLN